MGLKSDVRRAVKAAEKMRNVATHTRIDDKGVVDATLELPLDELRLKRGHKYKLTAFGFDEASFDTGKPTPLATDDAVVKFPVEVEVAKDVEGKAPEAPLQAFLPEFADTDVVFVAMRERSKFPFIVVFMLLVIAGLVAYLLSSWGDPRARPGYYEGKTKEEIQDDLNTEMDYYSMAISCASVINMRPESTNCEVRIENIVANHCDQKVKLYLEDDPSDVLFESGAISPGSYIQYVELAHPLSIGTHSVIAEFQGYESTPRLFNEDGQFLGHDKFGASCAAQITINVLPNEVFTTEE